MNNTAKACGCSIDRILFQDEQYIFITDAQKQSDTPAGKSYVAYSIRLSDIETRRRYSEFESLRKALCHLHPYLIVPPIPEKHSLVDYAALQTRVKDDLAMVKKRKRMLQTFLNRVARHPQLGRDHVFHRFLENGVIWSDVLHSPPLSTLPRNPLHMVLSKDSDLQHRNILLASNLIPIPSPTYILKTPNPQFEESEKFTFRIANYMGNNLDKSQRKVIRRLGELANDYAELGAVYNGFSLNESGALANAIEKIGQAVDTSYTETAQMVASLEGDFSEPIQEHSQFAQIVKQVLRFRHMKHAQVEMIEDSLGSKKETLEMLQQMESEAQRLEHAISSPEISNDADGTAAEQINNSPITSNTQVLARRSTTRPWSSPVRMMNAVGHQLQGMIDVDPEATRRNQIGKTKDAMEMLQGALDVTRKDLTEISSELKAELDRFQREKVKDLRDMLIAYAKIHARYCQKNLESWQEVRAEIDKIPMA
ncbi:sorting nexin-41 [Lichtheimia corymbifera JMRC:FSU:9682]|uniref:Sorting nexin-41 n=1 Tax=Lichtheimia corymbifera JMRC:FSU:9682 TaxID=1263082 RepID=A0A068S3U6_9FUNG|nr:sorting nexin-41 [Lichtheimia corymbifera JMRC:FSU:9682]